MKIVHKPVVATIYLAVFLAFSLTASVAHAGDLPDPKFTPGDTYPTLTKEIICSPAFRTKPLRGHRSSKIRDRIYKSYGMNLDEPPCPCEIDHLIPLSLGGSNRQSNLWPQSEMTEPWNSRVKDRLEGELHYEVCADKIDLDAAQHEIATDWIEVYKKRFGPR